jgi:hypothetical protein
MPTRNRYSLENLFGNVNVSRNIFPRLTGKIRKTDPDGSSLVSYFPSLTGKVLHLEYTREVVGVPTVFTADVTFAGNGLQDAIDQINAADTPNIEAADIDGFLSIRNKNSGKTNYLQINTSSNAAPILGFNQNPAPGSRSVAGEITNTPVDRKQLNPPGTGGIGRDETLEGASLNRALASFGELLARLSREQDREVAGFADVPLTGANFFTLTGKVAIKFSPAIAGMRLPLYGFPDAGVPSQPGLGRLGAFFKLQTATGEELILGNKDVARVTRVLWGNPATVSAFNDTQAFAVYSPLPSPTAFSIYGTGAGGVVSKLVKVASNAITEIQGNVVKCGGSPGFVTNGLVNVGDTAKISGSAVISPFGHNGEFIVDEIIDNNTLVLRPKTRFDPKADTALETPAELNQGTSGMGNLEILVGHFLNGAGIIVMTDCPAAQVADLNGSVLRYATGVRYKDMNVDKFARQPQGGIRDLLVKLAAVLAPDGASFIGGQATIDLLVGTVRSQLDQLATGWAKLDRENEFTKLQIFNGDLGDDSPALATVAAPAVRKLVWIFDDGVDGKIRLYFYAESNTPGFELTFNANWDPVGAQFSSDDPLNNSIILHFDRQNLEVRIRDVGETDPFSYFDMHVAIGTNFSSPTSFLQWNFPLPGGLNIADKDMSPFDPRLTFWRATDAEEATPLETVRTKLLADAAPVPVGLGGGLKSQFRAFLSPGGGSYATDSLELTFNADWLAGVPGIWVMDDPTQPAVMYRFDPYYGLQIRTRNTQGGIGSSDWFGLDSASFEDVLLLPTDDQSVPGPTGWNQENGLSNAGYEGFLGPVAGFKNLIFNDQVPKAWALIDVVNEVVLDGFGIASVEISGSSLLIHWAFPFATSDVSGTVRAVVLGTICTYGDSTDPAHGWASFQIKNFSDEHSELVFQSATGGGVVPISELDFCTFAISVFGVYKDAV